MEHSHLTPSGLPVHEPGQSDAEFRLYHRLYITSEHCRSYPKLAEAVRLGVHNKKYGCESGGRVNRSVYDDNAVIRGSSGYSADIVYRGD
ncbi:unnamed protein product [Danaus chrysippus]|uniref:(African queen) hypothetical protein n=1 Tax=Danaus chrysippus TaxID=151541 RepID=A0A8J2QDQ8_9NEOP|nr:unnamed protein product [Danaus chrysippus]